MEESSKQPPPMTKYVHPNPAGGQRGRISTFFLDPTKISKQAAAPGHPLATNPLRRCGTDGNTHHALYIPSSTCRARSQQQQPQRYLPFGRDGCSGVGLRTSYRRPRFTTIRAFGRSQSHRIASHRETSFCVRFFPRTDCPPPSPNYQTGCCMRLLVL